MLRSSDSPRFLHSAILTSEGFMLTFGGNTHNEASVNSGAKCYSLDFMAYDVGKFFLLSFIVSFIFLSSIFLFILLPFDVFKSFDCGPATALLLYVIYTCL